MRSRHTVWKRYWHVCATALRPATQAEGETGQTFDGFMFPLTAPEVQKYRDGEAFTSWTYNQIPSGAISVACRSPCDPVSREDSDKRHFPGLPGIGMAPRSCSHRMGDRQAEARTDRSSFRIGRHLCRHAHLRAIDPADGPLITARRHLRGRLEYFGGQGGIRTHGTLSRTHAFQACALNHSATCPFRPKPLE